MAESLEEGMETIMRTAVCKKSKRVIMRDGDPALLEKQFADMVVTEATEEAETVVESRLPKVIFSGKWANMLYQVLATVA